MDEKIKKIITVQGETYYTQDGVKKEPSSFKFLIIILILILGLIGGKYFLSSEPSEELRDFFQTYNAFVEASESSPNSVETENKRQKFIQLAMQITKLKSLNTSDMRGFLIASKCSLKDHDIHYVSFDGEHLAHVSINTPLHGLLDRGRQVLSENHRMPIRIIVLKDRLEIYNLEGKLLRDETAQEKYLIQII